MIIIETTDYIAFWGVLTGTIGLLIQIFSWNRSRANLKIKIHHTKTPFYVYIHEKYPFESGYNSDVFGCIPLLVTNRSTESISIYRIYLDFNGSTMDHENDILFKPHHISTPIDSVHTLVEELIPIAVLPLTLSPQEAVNISARIPSLELLKGFKHDSKPFKATVVFCTSR